MENPIQEKAVINTDLPTRFENFRDIHKDQSILVCGCGSSLNELAEPSSFITIGVNDVGRMFQPDYLLVLNGRNQFSSDRFRYVAESQAQAVFTHLNLGIQHPNIVRFTLGQRGGVDVSNPQRLPFTRNSPYVAVCLAIHMGAKRIGLIGVDFTENHFFAHTGRHKLAGELSRIKAEYERLWEASAKLGIEIVNLSSRSAVDTLPRSTLGEFSEHAKTHKSLNIVSYATTPVAGVPKILSQCITDRTPHQCRTVWATNHYGNGVRFDSDVEWSRHPNKAADLLQAADLVIVHNGRIDPRHTDLFKKKPVITLAHNYMWNVNQQFVTQGYPGLVVAQYQAALEEFKGWSAVPNPVPLWQPDFSIGEKDETISIAYTPSGRHEKYNPNHRLYWHSKGYNTTMAILQRLAEQYGVKLHTTASGQVSFKKSLEMKQHSHIVIDECVTGSYHRNSLEGLAAGAVVVNGLGLRDDIHQVFQHCIDDSAKTPFETSGLDTLEQVLIELIKKGRQHLVEKGQENWHWMQKHWDFSRQWQQFWIPAIKDAFTQSGHPYPSAATFNREPAPSSSPATTPLQQPVLKASRLHACQPLQPGVSVIIPFAGADRLPQLEAVLRRLKTQKGLHRIIVVELDSIANAMPIASKLADDYIFSHWKHPFNKSKAMNIGLPFVRNSHFMWLDGDLLLPDNFIQAAHEECEANKLDCLIPWDTVYYLSQHDSQQVMANQHQPQTCQPVHHFRSRRGAQGAAVMVRTEFALQYGGMFEQFHGWGGEDNAWFYKVNILGRINYTQDRQRRLYHLYHANSSGYCREGEHIAANPNYHNNFDLLKRIRGIRSPAILLEQFPPPLHHSAPWQGTKTLYCPKNMASIAEQFNKMYGNSIKLTDTPQDSSVDLTTLQISEQSNPTLVMLDWMKHITLQITQPQIKRIST